MSIDDPLGHLRSSFDGGQYEDDDWDDDDDDDDDWEDSTKEGDRHDNNTDRLKEALERLTTK